MLELIAATRGKLMQNNSLKPIKRRAGRAEFFSVRKEVETKILLGHPLTWLYTEYAGRI